MKNKVINVYFVGGTRVEASVNKNFKKRWLHSIQVKYIRSVDRGHYYKNQKIRGVHKEPIYAQYAVSTIHDP